MLNTHEEERRRLCSGLHDELGATLAGLTLKPGLARSLIDDNPEGIRSVLAEIEANLQTAVGRVRQLVDGLRPAHLDEPGLDAAIREQAEGFGAEGSQLEPRIRGHAEPGSRQRWSWPLAGSRRRP